MLRLSDGLRTCSLGKSVKHFSILVVGQSVETLGRIFTTLNVMITCVQLKLHLTIAS